MFCLAPPPFPFPSQEGSADILYDSIWGKIFSLPDDYTLYPAHDYKGIALSNHCCFALKNSLMSPAEGLTKTSVAEEKEFNPRLTKPRKEFIDIMDNLNLPYPRKIGRGLCSSKNCLTSFTGGTCLVFQTPPSLRTKFAASTNFRRTSRSS